MNSARRADWAFYELRDLAGVPRQSADVSTVGGFVTARFGHLPRQGEQIQVDEYLVTVEQVDRSRIELLHFKRDSPPLAGSDVSTSVVSSED